MGLESRVRPRLGINLSNLQYEPWPDGYVEQIIALHPEALLFMAYSPDIPSSLTCRDQLGQLIAALPGARVMLRILGDRTPTDPIERAREAARRHTFYGIAGAELVTHNERNLAAEAAAHTRVEEIIWWEKHLTELARQVPTIRRHLSGLAPIGDYLAWYEALAGSAIIQRLVDVVDVHAYDAGTLSADTARIAKLFPNAGVVVTEFNQIAPSRALAVAGPAKALLWFIAGGTNDQAQYDILRQPATLADFVAVTKGSPPMFSSPNHDGPRPQTLGVVIHSTRGGAANLQTEYDATVTWFDNPTSQVSAHAVIGPNHQLHFPVDPGLIAWHAREYNRHHLGIELVQPRFGDPLDPNVLDLAASQVAAWHKTFGFPLVWNDLHGICEHWEIPPGKRDGKTDIQAPFNRKAFLQRVIAYAEPLNRDELATFPNWARERLANGQDFRGQDGLFDFVAHLKGIGADQNHPTRYGWPSP
jgi:hypothetical protein